MSERNEQEQKKEVVQKVTKPKNAPKKPLQIPKLKDENENSSFADVLYDEITSVIGGNNPNQFFCMGLQGSMLSPELYAYDVANNEPKPAHVKMNESKLANKLYDPCFMSASDNGKHLHTQYRTALNMLTPKLNGKLFEAKSKLRKALMTPYPYNFGNGEVEVLTLEQVFYRLYAEYVEAKEKWAQKQLDKKTELEKKYPEDTDDDYKRREDEYIEWYGIVAEAEVLIVEEKLGKVLNVFSPGDMEIINGILDSGTGRELAEARKRMDSVERLNPDGGITYPVTFYPENWFSLLDTSFTPIDLLESPTALSQRMALLQRQRNSIMLNIENILDQIPDPVVVEALKAAYEEKKQAFDTAFNELQKLTITVTTDMLDTLLSIVVSKISGKAFEGTEEEQKQQKNQAIQDAIKSIPSNVIKKIFGLTGEEMEKIVDCLCQNMTAYVDAQNNVVLKSREATSVAVEWFELNNKLQLRNMLNPLQRQLDDIEMQISSLQEQINMSISFQPKKVTGTDGETEERRDVAPNMVPDSFVQLIVDSKMSAANTASKQETTAKEASYGVSFLLGGFSSNSSHQKAVAETFDKNSDMEIRIGMSLAKVEIEREWFEPGVFMLTTDMYNCSSEHIAPKEDYGSFEQKRLEEMRKCVFPCYPVAFVVAKDVTIQFYSHTDIATTFAQSIEEHSARGGGFFIFSGNSATSKKSNENSSTATSSDQSVTVRFTAPQILGYYLEAVPADKSVPISSQSSGSSADFISIFEFIVKFQEMLDEHNRNYHRNLFAE